MQYYICETECPSSLTPPCPIPSLHAGCMSTEAHSSQTKGKQFFHSSDPDLTQHIPESPWRWPLRAPRSWESTDISNIHTLQPHTFYVHD